MLLEDVIKSLDNLARSGWMIRGVPGSMAETVSQHLFSSSLIALNIAYKARDKGLEVDPLKAAVLALIHDLSESITGDIIPFHCPGKYELEEELVREQVENKRIVDLYMEFSRMETVEAKIARIADYLSTYVKAKTYSRLGYDVRDIMENSLRKAEELARSIGLDDIVELMDRV